MTLGNIPTPYANQGEVNAKDGNVSRTLFLPIMAIWSAYVKINNRLQYIPHFESVSNFGSDAKVEAQGRYGTQEVQLFPKSK